MLFDPDLLDAIRCQFSILFGRISFRLAAGSGSALAAAPGRLAAAGVVPEVVRRALHEVGQLARLGGDRLEA